MSQVALNLETVFARLVRETPFALSLRGRANTTARKQRGFVRTEPSYEGDRNG